MNRIEINFVECSAPGGYSVVYREKGTLDAFVSAGIFYSSPAIFFDTTHPDGTLFEGFISSIFPGLTCDQIPWETGGSGGSSSGSDTNILGTITFSARNVTVDINQSIPCDVTFPIDGIYDDHGTPTDFTANVTVLAGQTSGIEIGSIPTGVITCMKPTTSGGTVFIYSTVPCLGVTYVFILEIEFPC